MARHRGRQHRSRAVARCQGRYAVPGSGLGLAIVSDLVETYQGTLALSRSPLGGLKVQVSLPLPAFDA